MRYSSGCKEMSFTVSTNTKKSRVYCTSEHVALLHVSQNYPNNLILTGNVMYPITAIAKMSVK